MTNLTERAITVTGWTNPYARYDQTSAERKRWNMATGFYQEVAVITRHPMATGAGRPKNETVLKAQLYRTSNTVYCRLLGVNYRTQDSFLITGKESGCGVEKSSSAILNALYNAGFEFNCSSMGGMKHAHEKMLAVASYMTEAPKSNFFIYVAG